MDEGKSLPGMASALSTKDTNCVSESTITVPPPKTTASHSAKPAYVGSRMASCSSKTAEVELHSERRWAGFVACG